MLKRFIANLKGTCALFKREDLAKICKDESLRMSFSLFPLAVCHPESLQLNRREKLLFETRNTSRLSNILFPTLVCRSSGLIFTFGLQVASYISVWTEVSHLKWGIEQLLKTASACGNTSSVCDITALQPACCAHDNKTFFHCQPLMSVLLPV